jgi:chromosome segregation ATPase
MTPEEMERAIAFIVGQQAQASASMAQIHSTQAEINVTMARQAERLDRLTERTDRNAEGITALLAIAEIHEREITVLRQTQAEAEERGRRLDERLNALINIVERHIREGRNGRA